MKKNKKNIFLIRLNFILNFILLKYFKNANSANKRKIIIHILKAHKIVLIYLNIILFLLNLFSILRYRVKIENNSLDKIEIILYFFKKIKIFQIEKFIDLFHAISTIHIDAKEKKRKIKFFSVISSNYFENIVIGSGPGGSITALEIQKQNKDILIIEKGDWIDQFKLKHPGEELLAKWKYGGFWTRQRL